MKRQFQDYELSAFIEGKEEDYDVEQIVEECTYIDYKTGIRYWDETADLNAICQKNRITRETTLKPIYKDVHPIAAYEAIEVSGTIKYKLYIDQRIKTNGHVETFASFEVMAKFLDWLFDEDWHTEPPTCDYSVTETVKANEYENEATIAVAMSYDYALIIAKALNSSIPEPQGYTYRVRRIYEYDGEYDEE